MQHGSVPSKIKILLVDDDRVVLRLFRDGLTRSGFDVRTAYDGLEAVKVLQEMRPDILVLDLMMPKFTGVDVVKFIRGRSDLADLPVIVLSNSYVDELAQAVHEAGVQEALLKSRCTPSALAESIHHTLASGSSTTAQWADAEADFKIKARHDFLASASDTCAALRQLFEAFKAAQTDIERGLRLQDFYRRVHYVTATAGLAGCSQIERMSSLFEALLFVLMDDSARLNASVWNTIAATMDFLEVLFQTPAALEQSRTTKERVLIVDDDVVITHAIVSTMRRLELDAYSANNPMEGLHALKSVTYDLILLDIDMPGLDGFEFCRHARQIPGYEQTPIVFVTNYAAVENRAEAYLSGGNDLIAKPIFPMELAVKAIMSMLKKNLDS